MSEGRPEATFTEVGSAEARASEERRRQHPRYRVKLDVTVGSEHNFYAGFVENLSAGGIFIATHKAAKVGEILEFDINLPEAEQSVRGTGEVRWVREFSETSDVSPGLGIRFVELEDGALQTIETFLKNRDPLFYDDE